MAVVAVAAVVVAVVVVMTLVVAMVMAMAMMVIGRDHPERERRSRNGPGCTEREEPSHQKPQHRSLHVDTPFPSGMAPSRTPASFEQVRSLHATRATSARLITLSGRPVRRERAGCPRRPSTSLFSKVDGDGPTCPMLHGGLGTDHVLYRRTLQGLGHRLRLVLLDHRGNGRSGLPAAEVVVPEASNHFPWVEEPESFFKAVEGWLAAR